MKKLTKYQVLKWLVLITAIFSVVYFFTPFVVVVTRDYIGGPYYSFTAYGYDFFTGFEFLSNALVILTWISFLVALTADAFAILPFVSKNAIGLNKKGKFHKSLIISAGLSFVSALINFFTMLPLAIGEAKKMTYVIALRQSSYNAFQCFYTYIGLIVIAVLLIPIVLLIIKTMPKKVKTTTATENEETGEVAEVKINKPAATAKKQSAPQTAADNPANKPLEWFTSEAGLEAFKTYTSAQNYILEENLRKEKEQKYSDWNFDEFLIICHKGVKLPCQYFEALIANIDAEPLKYVGPHDILIGMLKTISQPYSIDEDGEPVPCELAMPPEKILSVEKNPLLYFVKNFDVFKMKDDELGALKDKIALYSQILFFVSVNMYSLVIEDNKWLFDKSTYINDLGIVRKEKAFLKKCKELSGFPEYFDEELAKLG